jgi:hypothetical protein
MHRTEAIAWVACVCAGCLRLSQARTLAILVASAVHVRRASLANLGRGMIGTAKHQIKRAWRFCAYDRIETTDAMRGVVKKVLKKRKNPLLADRGFGRTELARFCQKYGFDYVIRIQPNVHVRCVSYCGKLLDYPVHKGICRLLKQVDYRKHNSVSQNIVVRWVRDLPAKRDECWFLMTSLSARPARLSHLYGRRMTIEQLFRDYKSKRNGWSLRDTQLTTPQRLDRLLLILAIAYLLLCGIGLMAQKRFKPGDWCSNNKATTCSIFLIGQQMLRKLNCSPPQDFAAFLRATQEAVTKWGSIRMPACTATVRMRLYVKVFGLRVVGDDRVGGLLGDEHEVLSQGDGDGLGIEQFDDESAVFEVGACRVAEGIAGAAIPLLEELTGGGGVFAGEAKLGADAFVPEFSQRLGGFDAEAVEVEVILVFVVEAKFLGDLGGAVADGDELDSQNVVLAGFEGSEEVADAESAAAILTGEGEAEVFARLGGGAE